MKLRNKKTGEIGWLYCDHISVPKKMTVFSEDKDLSANHWDYKSLAELNEEWEDYEEDEYYYAITSIKHDGGITKMKNKHNDMTAYDKSIGNYFPSKEEAEKAVEKLKAWKRLKDKGFRFTSTPGVGSLDITPGKFQIEINADMPAKWFCRDAVQKNLDTCFGGEE